MNNTHVSFILDRSGSMASIADDTRGAFNNFIKEQKKIEGNMTVSLYRFDNEFETVYQYTELKNVPPLNLEPRGSTALLDAIGRVINKLKVDINKSVIKPDKVIVVVMTDGYENASREHTKISIRNLLSEAQEFSGWELVFMGTNQDAILTGQEYGFSAANSLTYRASGQSVSASYGALSENISGLRTNSLRNVAFTSSQREQVDSE